MSRLLLVFFLCCTALAGGNSTIRDFERAIKDSQSVCLRGCDALMEYAVHVVAEHTTEGDLHNGIDKELSEIRGIYHHCINRCMNYCEAP